jgi:NADP-dependent 3-hydroxy acid dehydrogenase YdfG
MPNFDISNLFGVRGIVAVITGGGSGLGLYVAKALDANGARAVYIVGRRQETLEKAAKQAINGTIIPLQGDVTSKESLEAIAERVRKEQGFINVLLANSGIIGVDISKQVSPPTASRQ